MSPSTSRQRAFAFGGVERRAARVRFDTDAASCHLRDRRPCRLSGDATARSVFGGALVHGDDRVGVRLRRASPSCRDSSSPSIGAVVSGCSVSLAAVAAQDDVAGRGRRRRPRSTTASTRAVSGNRPQARRARAAETCRPASTHAGARGGPIDRRRGPRPSPHARRSSARLPNSTGVVERRRRRAARRQRVGGAPRRLVGVVDAERWPAAPAASVTFSVCLVVSSTARSGRRGRLGRRAARSGSATAARAVASGHAARRRSTASARRRRARSP